VAILKNLAISPLFAIFCNFSWAEKDTPIAKFYHIFLKFLRNETLFADVWQFFKPKKTPFLPFSGNFSGAQKTPLLPSFGIFQKLPKMRLFFYFFEILFLSLKSFPFCHFFWEVGFNF